MYLGFNELLLFLESCSLCLLSLTLTHSSTHQFYLLNYLQKSRSGHQSHFAQLGKIEVLTLIIFFRLRESIISAMAMLTFLSSISNISLCMCSIYIEVPVKRCSLYVIVVPGCIKTVPMWDSRLSYPSSFSEVLTIFSPSLVSQNGQEFRAQTIAVASHAAYVEPNIAERRNEFIGLVSG